MGTRIIYTTSDGVEYILPNASVTMTAEEWDDYPIDNQRYVPTHNTWNIAINAQEVDAGLFSILTGKAPSSETPIFDALVKKYVKSYTDSWNF